MRKVEGRKILTVQDISKQYGHKRVLQEVRIEITKPEIFGLLGPSGAGKTTLVKMIAGMESPSKGTIYVFQEEMPDLHLMERIGYMGQSDALYEELTAKENLHFFAQLYGLRGKQVKEKTNEVLEIVDLQEDADVLVNRFSGGMKRRLSLAIALIHEPELLILDEPTVGIDPVLRYKLWETFQVLKQKGVTVLVTTHVMDEAERCDRLGMIREGKLIAVGTPDELKSDTAAVTMEDAFLTYGGMDHAD